MTDQFAFQNPIMPGSIWGKDSDYEVTVVSPVGEGPKGAKGDAAYFSDLTSEEKAEIYRSMSFVGNEIVDAFYTTTSTSTATIAIPIPDYNEYDLLWVFIEGLFLLENLDYTVNNGSIVLASPITHAGTKVLFRALRFSTPDGNKQLNVNQITEENNTINYNATALTGTGAPSQNATYVGQLYIDTDSEKIYVAKTVNGDWIEL